jgi:hypothetical protein
MGIIEEPPAFAEATAGERDQRSDVGEEDDEVGSQKSDVGEEVVGEEENILTLSPLDSQGAKRMEQSVKSQGDLKSLTLSPLEGAESLKQKAESEEKGGGNVLTLSPLEGESGGDRQESKQRAERWAAVSTPAKRISVG